MLGALIDLGVPLADIRGALGGLDIDGDAVWTERVSRAGIAATKFCVRGEDHGPAHQAPSTGHEHTHDHHGSTAPHSHGSADGHHPAVRHAHAHRHRSLAEIGALIDTSGLSSVSKRRAKELFDRLGRVEAAIHGVPMAQVHLHEVGALDSIIDIVGAVYALESLGVDRMVSSALNVGGGTISSAHGHYPVPAPATLQLLEGVPVYSGQPQFELVTPTGALLISGYAEAYGGMPAMRIERVGYGAGARDFHERPNVLRATVGTEEMSSSAQSVVVIETAIDDMNPQIFGVLMDELLAQGALDVFYTPVQMKKNRPGTLVTVVSRPEDRERHSALIFRETTTIGVRFREMQRECLTRETVPVLTPYGPVMVKVARRSGHVLNVAPEFDDCARLARQSGHAVKDVQAAATKAFHDLSR